MKYLKQGLLLSAVIFISSTIVVHALSPAEPELRPFTLVEKTVWGSGPYWKIGLAKNTIFGNSSSGFDVLTHSKTKPFKLKDQLPTSSLSADWLISEANSDYVFRMTGNHSSSDITIMSFTANDLSDGDKIETPLDTFILANTLNMSNAEVVDGFLYFNAGSDGLFIFDVSDPADIKQVSQTSLISHNHNETLEGQPSLDSYS